MNQLGQALTSFDDPPVSVLFVYNCNPVATAPDQNRVRQGLAREDLFTVVHEQVMTDTAQYADVLLPATTFLEQYDVARGYGAYHLHVVQPAIDALEEARPNHEVFRALGARLGLSEPDELGEIGGLIEITSGVPSSYQAALRDGAAAPPPHDGQPVQFDTVFPGTPDGRVALFPADLPSRHGLYHYEADPATERFPLTLISPASEHTISSTLGELRPGIAKVRIHPDDAHARSIGEGDSIKVFNELGEVHCEASVTPETRPGCVSLPKGLWGRSTFNGSTSNALVPDTLTDIAGGACFNDARVQVELLGRH
jgi:anaerobic selenocysteine-containing dehydrogenase